MPDPLASEQRDVARTLACLDLTDLSDPASEPGIDSLCRKAVAGGVAAVCVWPQMVSRARSQLGGSRVAIATVVNFPAGGEEIERVVEDTSEALHDGATEIDLVLPYRTLLEGRPQPARDMVAAVRDVVDGGRLLKVILETGALRDPALIDEASRIAIDGGADFLKTSTGKLQPGATHEAAEIMLQAIRMAGRKVGIKPSGGIRTFEDAKAYLALADRVMGPSWVTPATFRIGASALYDALMARRPG